MSTASDGLSRGKRLLCEERDVARVSWTGVVCCVQDIGWTRYRDVNGAPREQP